MEKLLIFIKHHVGFLWKVIEWGNGVVFALIYRSELLRILRGVFSEYTLDSFSFIKLSPSNAKQLYELIKKQKDTDLEYFHPHGFGLKDIENQFNNRALLMMGVFDKDNLIGYFFLRFFCNRKCFVGRLIDEPYRGRGIGNVMNAIMYEVAWQLNFKCLSTISRNNRLVMHAHSRNSHIKVIKELQNDYLLVEFVRD